MGWSLSSAVELEQGNGLRCFGYARAGTTNEAAPASS
jgi:hypothetical protein